MLVELPLTRAAARTPVTSDAAGSFSPRAFFPFLLDQFFGRLFKELRCGPLLHIEVALDVAVLQHEVLADLDLR